MAKNDITALRDHLFDVIERLKSVNDPDADIKDKIDLESAKAIIDCSQVIVNSAKVEVDMINALSRSDNPAMLSAQLNRSKFLPVPEQK